MRTSVTRQPGIAFQLPAAIAIAVLLHYAIAPAESGGSGFALYLRFAVAMLAGLVVLLANADQIALQRLLTPLVALALWILLINFRTTTWYAVMFAGFAVLSAMVSTAFVAGPLRQKFVLALDVLLAFWVGAFIVQFLIFFGSGAIVDVHAIFHPYSEARIFAEGDSSLFRLTGPHIEPGTYANWVYGLVILRSIVRRRWFDFVGIAAVATTLLSFSLWAMLGAAAWFAGALLHSLASLRLATLIKLLLALMLIAGVFAFFAGDRAIELFDYLMQRANPSDGSSGDKFMALQGFGREFWDVLVIGTTFEHDFCNGCLSPQDAGVGINMVMRLGLIASVCIFFPVARSAYLGAGIGGLTAAGPLLFSKFYVFDPIVWIIVGVALLEWRGAVAGRRACVPRPPAMPGPAVGARQSQ